jgi:hypothetical protein
VSDGVVPTRAASEQLRWSANGGVCHDQRRVTRHILIIVLCFAVALLGISGLHGHLAGPHESPTHEKHGFQLVTVADQEHAPDHSHDGDVDIDPLVKAFGKLPVIKSFIAIVVAYLIVGLLTSAPARRLLRATRRRPPRARHSPYFLPPSHAPPRTAFTR